MRSLLFLTGLSASLAGCAGENSRPTNAAEQTPRPDARVSDAVADKAICDLGSLDIDERDNAEIWLIHAGFPVLARCTEALLNSTDSEQKLRLARVCREIEASSFQRDLARIWRDQRFALRKAGNLVGFEHDRAWCDEGYYEFEDDDAGNSPPTDKPAIRAWGFQSTLTLCERPGDPSLAIDVLAICRVDGALSPVDVSWSVGSLGPKVWVGFNSKDGIVRIATDAHGSERTTERLPLDIDPHLVCLEINASRLVERAALFERTELSMRLFRCGDPPDGRTREYSVRLDGRDVLEWDGEKLAVLKYVEMNAPEETRDVYYVNKERGLIAGRIRGFDLVRLRCNPYEDTLKGQGK